MDTKLLAFSLYSSSQISEIQSRLDVIYYMYKRNKWDTQVIRFINQMREFITKLNEYMPFIKSICKKTDYYYEWAAITHQSMGKWNNLMHNNNRIQSKVIDIAQIVLINDNFPTFNFNGKVFKLFPHSINPRLKNNTIDIILKNRDDALYEDNYKSSIVKLINLCKDIKLLDKLDYNTLVVNHEISRTKKCGALKISELPLYFEYVVNNKLEFDKCVDIMGVNRFFFNVKCCFCEEKYPFNFNIMKVCQKINPEIKIIDRYFEKLNEFVINSDKYFVKKCSNTTCNFKYPYYLELDDNCIDCKKNYLKDKKSFYHHYRCFGCKEVSCLFCNKKKEDHIDGMLCQPKVSIYTEEEIVEFTKNDYKFCPSCNTATQKEAGCDHIKCENCKIHWCWRCKEFLVLSKITHYIHFCSPDIDSTPIDTNYTNIINDFMNNEGKLPLNDGSSHKSYGLILE